MSCLSYVIKASVIEVSVPQHLRSGRNELVLVRLGQQSRTDRLTAIETTVCHCLKSCRRGFRLYASIAMCTAPTTFYNRSTNIPVRAGLGYNTHIWHAVDAVDMQVCGAATTDKATLRTKVLGYLLKSCCQEGRDVGKKVVFATACRIMLPACGVQR